MPSQGHIVRDGGATNFLDSLLRTGLHSAEHALRELWDIITARVIREPSMSHRVQSPHLDEEVGALAAAPSFLKFAKAPPLHPSNRRIRAA